MSCVLCLIDPSLIYSSRICPSLIDPALSYPALIQVDRVDRSRGMVGLGEIEGHKKEACVPRDKDVEENDVQDTEEGLREIEGGLRDMEVCDR